VAEGSALSRPALLLPPTITSLSCSFQALILVLLSFFKQALISVLRSFQALTFKKEQILHLPNFCSDFSLQIL